ncbi:MAG: nucleotidyltransferase domain-containing protein, partial [Candidatus Aenigmatarchaeota archaeon]
DRIILFGSRARGDYKEDSDYDLLIVTKNKLNKNTKENFAALVEIKLIRVLNKPIDLIITNKRDFEKNSKYIGYLFYWVKKEGIKV